MFPSGNGFKNKPQKIFANRRDFRICYDETMIKVGSEYIWLWVAIVSKNNEILILNMYKEKYVCRDIWFVTELVKFMGYIQFPQMWYLVLSIL